MLRALPILWFLVAVLGAFAQLAVAGMTGMDVGTAYNMFGSASLALTGAVSASGFALVYLLIQRTRPSPAVTIVGYSHLFLGLSARIAQAVGDLERNRYLAGNAPADYSMLGFAYTASGLASLLGGIVFILALIVALNTRHHERPQDVFS